MAPTFSTTFSIQDMLRDTTKKFFPLTIALKIMLIRRRNTNLKKSSNKTKMPPQSCTMKSSLNLLRFNDDFIVHDWGGIFVLLLDFFRFVFRLLISIIFSAIVSGKNFFVVSRNMSWIEKVVEKVGAMDLYHLMSSHFHS